MRVEVSFLPDHLETVTGRVCLVIDVLRASSVAVALLEAGASGILLADNHQEALRLKGIHGSLLIGEEVGRTGAAPGCDLAPSPTQIVARDLRGQPVIFFTTNGTVAIQRTWEASRVSVYVACLANLGTAAAAAAAAAAARACDLAVVCAGRRRSRRFALDDAYCAGLLVERLFEETGRLGTALTPEDGATAARRLAAGFSTPLDALAGSATGRMLSGDGQEHDIAWCARLDSTRIVPAVRPSAEGLWLVVHRDREGSVSDRPRRGTAPAEGV